MTATTTSAIFTAAHLAAKVADKVVAYKVRFSTALRAAWAATKQTAQTVMTIVIENHTGRILMPYATAQATAEAVAAEVKTLLAAADKSHWASFRNLKYDALAGKLDVEGQVLQAVYTAQEVVNNLAMEFGCYAGYAASAAEANENR